VWSILESIAIYWWNHFCFSSGAIRFMCFWPYVGFLKGRAALRAHIAQREIECGGVTLQSGVAVLVES
jgi:hypothetical protein